MLDDAERAELDEMKDQVRLLTQMVIRNQLTIVQITGGKEITQTIRPGHEGEVLSVPVMDGAPNYRLVAVATAQPSKIIGLNGANLRIAPK